jgi:hypothetical protein
MSSHKLKTPVWSNPIHGCIIFLGKDVVQGINKLASSSLKVLPELVGGVN